MYLLLLFKLYSNLYVFSSKHTFVRLENLTQDVMGPGPVLKSRDQRAVLAYQLARFENRNKHSEITAQYLNHETNGVILLTNIVILYCIIYIVTDKTLYSYI